MTGALLVLALALQAPDVTPPEAIDDVEVEGFNEGKVLEVAWTAPPEDAGSPAWDAVHHYRVFVADSEITAATLGSAKEITDDLPLPVHPGDMQGMRIEHGLDFHTRYWVAVIGVDEAGNQGPVSNSPSARTGRPCLHGATGSFALPVIAGLVLLGVVGRR